MERPYSLYSSSSSSAASTSSFSPSHHHHHHYQHDLPKNHSYEVFLSFRGEDTRLSFTSHLNTALRQKGINTFLDDKLERGKSISPELLKAIEGSTCSLVILSPNYASSTWCLDELVKIIHCMTTMGQIVLPIFYHVDPSDVRKQSGPFKQAFAKHEHDFRDIARKVQTWRAAFKEVANLGGWDLANKNEAECIQEIVAEISNKVIVASINHSEEGLFGMDSRIEKLNSYVDIGSDGIRAVGICGMGGLGKTTLARVYYNYMSSQFEGSSFLANVREVCEKMTNGLESLQEQLLSETLKGNQQIKIWNSFQGTDMIRRRLRHKKILVVIDDVNDFEQLEKLAGGLDWFGSGTRIIVTTRDESLLTGRGWGVIYKIEQLNENEAHQHFAWNAFKSTSSLPPLQEYALLSKQVVKYCDGLPLALKILGSFLCGKSVNEWKSALERLQESPNKKIFAALRISFEGLEETEKDIFLDVACFFKGMDKDFVTRILNGCGFHPDIGIRSLLDKSLLTISENNNKLWMHDLLEEMGTEIVREESRNEPGRRSRLWHCDDVLHVLKNDTGSDAVKAIVVEFPFKKETAITNFEAFSKMKKLRLLKLKCQYFFPDNKSVYNQPRLCDINGYLSESLPTSLQPDEHFSNELCLLDVDGYPYESFPSSFQPDGLIELNLFNGRMKQLWNTHIKPLCNLSVIDLSCCRYLIKIFRDFSAVPNLEKLILKCCEELMEIDSSICVLEKLTVLDMEQCAKLRKLPNRIKGLKALKVLNLNSCSMLRKLPKDIWQLKNLEQLNLSGTVLENLSSSIFSVNFVRPPPFQRVSKALSTGLFSLRGLYLSHCGIRELPKELGCLVSLEKLDLSHNFFHSLPASIRLLSKLTHLYLDSCVELRSLAELPLGLLNVYARSCFSLETFLDPSKQCNPRLFSGRVEGCLELVRRQGSSRTALTALTRFLQNPAIFAGQTFDIVLPGSEIAKWFSHQVSGSSISIELPPNWRDQSYSKLMGWAFCVCLEPSHEKYNLAIDMDINGEFIIGYPFDNSHTESLNLSDNLWILYITQSFVRGMLDTDICDPVTISFVLRNHQDVVFTQAKRFGMRLVYEETVPELDQIISNNCSSEWE